jgi:hypothetical protein
MCRWPQTSGYSYPRVSAIRIDVHSVGETQPTHHTHPTSNPHMVSDHTYLTWSTHSNISLSCQQIWTDPLLPRRKAPDPTHSILVDRSMGLYPASLLEQPKKQWGEKPSFYWQLATRLTGTISPACDRYVQYLLAGVNPLVINRHRQGLQPPKGPARSQVIQSQHSLK